MVLVPHSHQKTSVCAKLKYSLKTQKDHQTQDCQQLGVSAEFLELILHSYITFPALGLPA